jgi:hypothetical protein
MAVNLDEIVPVGEQKNPQEGIDKATGVYHDAANHLTPEQQFTMLPRVELPSPLRLGGGKASGARK